MDTDRFWDLIEQARAKAGPMADQAVRDYDEPSDDPDHDYWNFEEIYLDAGLNLDDDSDEDSDESDEDDDLDEFDDDEDDEITDAVATALIDVLAALPPEEIAAFETTFEQVRSAADKEDLANAAALIEHGFLGDESFDDFRAGLVAMGRQAYEKAVANPDSLAEHPMVREIAAATDPRWLGREDLLYAASHAYATSTGKDEVSFYDYMEELAPVSANGAANGSASGTADEEWSLDDEALTRTRLPRLADLFYERSMRNRRRAEEALGIKA